MEVERELVEVWKKFKNPNYLGAVVGEVIETFPNLRIAIDDKIIIEKDQIFVSKHLMKDYERDFEFESAKFQVKGNKFSLSATPVITDTTPGGPRLITTFPEGQTTNVELEGTSTIRGKIKFVDTILKGDMVLLIATMDNQNFFLIDKGVSL